MPAEDRGDFIPAEDRDRVESLTDRFKAICGTEAGLEPWQFYGPSTRHDNRIFVFLLMRPYDTVTVRGLAFRRIAGVT